MDIRNFFGWLCVGIAVLLFFFGWFRSGNSLWFVDAAGFITAHDSSDLIEDGWNVYGRLSIPDVGFEANLFYTDETEDAQVVVDAKNSAAWIPNWDVDMPLIADHDFQGFKKMRAAVPGETVAIVDFGDSSVQYICIDVFEGWNTGPDITDLKDVSIEGRNDGGIAMYTCNSDLGKKTITISLWQPF